MFGFIKKWFKKKEEPKEEHYIDFHKLRQRELEEDFNGINHYTNLRYVTERIPYRWVDHIDKCVQYDEIEIAIEHLHFWDKFCNCSALCTGCRLDLTQLWDKIKNSKRFKEIMIKEKLERMKKDFE